MSCSLKNGVFLVKLNFYFCEEEKLKILVLNCGSSSVKYQFIDVEKEKALAKGLVERIGLDGSRLKHRDFNNEFIIEEQINDHQEAINLLLKVLTDSEKGIIKDIREIEAVGHRVVHGGEFFTESTLITDEVLKSIEACIPLAPLHNPANLMGIEAAKKILPDIPHVAVFDTSFHQTMPPVSYLYAIPYKYYRENKIRRYGFHGTSHRFVSQKACEFLGVDKEKVKIITLHLGNGASASAIKHGKSIDTSMGFTPLEGLVMGTRSGDIDPAIPMFLMREFRLSPEQVDSILNKKSGMLGLTEKSSDLRDIEKLASEGDELAKIAIEIYAYRIRKYIGMYLAVLEGADIIVFTAGVGENSWLIREKTLKGFNWAGIEIDPQKNRELVGGKIGLISKESSKVKVLVIPTNEELLIAKDTREIVLKEGVKNG